MKKVMGKQVKVTDAAISKVVQNEGTSKSAKMKELFDMGIEVKEIASIMAVRYNFVYNVVSNYCAMNGIKTETTKKAGKKDEIIRLHQEGKTNKEISVELKTNYNYVFNCIKAFKAEQAAQEAK